MSNSQTSALCPATNSQAERSRILEAEVRTSGLRHGIVRSKVVSGREVEGFAGTVIGI